MKNLKDELLPPINVPIIQQSNSTHDSVWHISFMALFLLASIFMIVFATFSSAQAFTLNHETNAFDHRIGYAPVDKNKLRVVLPNDEQQREVLPNIEETAFYNMIKMNAVERILIEALVPNARQRILIQPVGDDHSMSGAMQNVTIGYLAALFAFMTWVTAMMWREFARNNAPKRHKF